MWRALIEPAHQAISCSLPRLLQGALRVSLNGLHSILAQCLCVLVLLLPATSAVPAVMVQICLSVREEAPSSSGWMEALTELECT